MPKMSSERLKAHQEMKQAALSILEGLKGEDIQIGALRDRLGITTDEGRRVLAQALEGLRDDDHLARRGRCLGWWKWAPPVQQPLPVAQAPATVPPLALAAQTGLKAETVEALRARLVHARQKHPNEGYTGLQWLTALVKEYAEAQDSLCDEGHEGTGTDVEAWVQRVKSEAIDVATVALRMVEEWGQ